MLNNKPLNQILFLDLETVPQFESFFDMPVKLQELFFQRFKKDFELEDINILPNSLDSLRVVESTESIYGLKGSLYPEFGKIICASFGFISGSELIVTSITGHSDKEILSEVTRRIKAINTWTGDKSDYHFCAHNGKVFDFPFMAKRYVINGLDLPKPFDIAEKKPWDLVNLIDTKEVWKFGVFDHNVSLDLLAATFGVESSKDEMDGSMVKHVYYKENNLEKIAKYCEKDVIALAQVYIKMRGDKTVLTIKSK